MNEDEARCLPGQKFCKIPSSMLTPLEMGVKTILYNLKLKYTVKL